MIWFRSHPRAALFCRRACGALAGGPVVEKRAATLYYNSRCSVELGAGSGTAREQQTFSQPGLGVGIRVKTNMAAPSRSAAALPQRAFRHRNGRWQHWGVLLTGALAAGAAPCVAQEAGTGSVRGVVLNLDGLVPIPHAEVSVEDTRFRTLTGDDGTYTLERIPVGEYRLQVRRIGFELILTNSLAVLRDSIRVIDLALRASPVPLEAVEIEAAPPTAPHRPSATVLTSKDLPPQGDILTALQGRIPGLRMSGRYDNMRVRLRGGTAEPMFVIDGVIVRPPLRFYIGATEVECVEVRRGRQAALEFRSSNQIDTYNGVILIWTKQSTRRMTGACATAL